MSVLTDRCEWLKEVLPRKPEDLWRSSGLLSVTEGNTSALRPRFARIWWKPGLFCLYCNLCHWRKCLLKRWVRINFDDQLSLVFCKSHLKYKAKEEFITIFPVALLSQQKSWNIRCCLLSSNIVSGWLLMQSQWLPFICKRTSGYSICKYPKTHANNIFNTRVIESYF